MKLILITRLQNKTWKHLNNYNMKENKNTAIKTVPVPRNNNLMIYLLLIIISFGVYTNSLFNEFVFDDDSVVLGDPAITSVSNIPKFFTAELGFHKVIGRYYRPVVSASYTLDHAIWGFKPFGFHLTNVLIHVINVLLLFVLLKKILWYTGFKYKNTAVLAGTILFALHPVHTEAVAWISGRTDSLSCTFFFASFIYYLNYSRFQSSKNLSLTLLFYLLALLSKEMAITLPAAIIIYDLTVNKIKLKEILNDKLKIYLSLVILSAFYLVIRWLVLKDVTPRDSYLYFYGKDFYAVLFTMLQTLPVYFKLAVLPVGMLYHYGGYLPYISSPLEPSAIFALVFLTVIIISAVYLYKRMPLFSYALIFFFLTLLPVLNIVPTMNFMADRFLYIPSVFLSFIAVSLLIRYYTPKNRNIVFGLFGAVFITFSLMTIARNAEWKTNDSLFLSAEGKPGTVLYVNIGNIYANKGNYGIAEDYYRKAIDLNVPSVLAYNNLGKIFMINNIYDSAYFYISKAYMLDTLSPEPVHSLGVLHARFHMNKEAVKWLEKLQTISPDYMNSAAMLQELKLQIELNSLPPGSNLPGMETPGTDIPGNINPGTGNMSRVALLEQSSYSKYNEKKYEEAIAELRELVSLNPQRASVYFNNMGMCYLDYNRLEDALESFKQSVKSDPGFSTGYNNLGMVYEKLGNIPKAKENYSKAVETDPANENAKSNLSKLK